MTAAGKSLFRHGGGLEGEWPQGDPRPQWSILIVEDDQGSAQLLELVLRELGYRVSGNVTSAAAAIRSASDDRPDLALMDIRLEGSVDGIEAARILNGKLGIPVVYITGLADRRTLRRARDTDPFGYLVKPFEAEELERTIELAVHKHVSEERIRKRERLWAALVESDPEAVVVVDEAGRIVSLNPVAESLLGYRSAEVEGRAAGEIVKLVSGDGGSPLTPARLAAERRVSIPLVNVLLLERNGAELRVGGSVSPIIETGGAVVGSVFKVRVVPPAADGDTCDLNALLAESRGVLMHLAGPTMRVIYELDDDTPAIAADRRSVQQLVVEMIALACVATSSGVLSIRTGAAGLLGGIDRRGASITPGRYAMLAVRLTGEDERSSPPPGANSSGPSGDEDGEGTEGGDPMGPILALAGKCGVHLLMDDDELRPAVTVYFPARPQDDSQSEDGNASRERPTGALRSGRRRQPLTTGAFDAARSRLGPTGAAQRLHHRGWELVADCMRGAQHDEPPDLVECERLTRLMASSLAAGPELLVVALDREQPPSTSAHCVGVAVIALQIASTCGLAESERQLAAMAGLLHELTANRFPRRLVHRPERLGAEDATLLRAAPVRSAELVRKAVGAPERLAAMIAQVYERADGSGFPAGLKGDEIDEAASIVAIADVFDSHIRDQPGSPAITGFDAVSRLVEEGRELFSPRAVKGLLRSFSVYPHGEYVLLSSGEIGKVIAVNPAVPSRPRVNVIVDERGHPDARERTLDLAEHPMIHVVAALRADEVPE